jgi:enamine deaminase RidA (YjgF/YER057c/UK114 family)
MSAFVHEILHPANWKKASGYANGIAASGRTVFVGGQIGWNGGRPCRTSSTCLPRRVQGRNIWCA